jgi:hypothetical protein
VVVCDGVVVAAEQDEVVQVGGSAVGPVDDVVGDAPGGWAGAAGEGAAAVSGGEGGELGGGGGAVFAADLEYGAGWVE